MSTSIENLSGARVMVTGGAGFIGSEVVHQLAAVGAKAIVVDNLVNGKRDNIESLISDTIKLEVADIRDSSRIKKLLEGVDILLHLACLGVRHSIHSPIENHEVNATSTLELLESARLSQIKRFVHVSTSEVYGTAQTVPIREDHPTWPQTVYGASKLGGEKYAAAYWETYKFPTVILRPFNSYGHRSHHEGDSGEVIPKFLLRALAGRPLLIHGDGTQTRDFSHVSDTARSILLAAITPEIEGETINIGQGKEISINELADTICAITGRNEIKKKYTPKRPGDVLRLCADSSKAKNLLGYGPTITLMDGLKKMSSWYQNSGLTIEDLLKEELEKPWIVKSGKK